MSLDSTTHAADGTVAIPMTDADWHEWVSATATRHYTLQDPILDWLDLYGSSKGFQRDDALPRYDSRTDFTKFLFKKAKEFEAAVFLHMKTLTTVVTISSSIAEIRDINKVKETFVAMKEGIPVIYQGVLRDAKSLTYGVPDLLVRSDELLRLFPGALLSKAEAIHPAADLEGAKWHYRVVDIKFTTLHLLAGGELGNTGSAPAYKVALFIYNRALGRLQGYEPPVSYLLGRSWEQPLKGVSERGDNCMERLAPITQDSDAKKGTPLSALAQEGCEWIRRVRQQGSQWNVLPEPSVLELRPNMGNTEDAPWRTAKKQIAKQLEELTLLWQVGHDKGREANSRDIYRWRSPQCTAVSIGVTGPKTQPILQAMLNINQSNTGPPVAPPHIKASEDIWRCEPTLEFYIDFETVNGLNDDFSQMPMRHGVQMIFMIGCGHIENGSWKFQCFTADTLTEPDEAGIVEAWVSYMYETSSRLRLVNTQPLLIHWSNAEISNFEGAYNATCKRHPERSKNWPSLHWFDLLKAVFKEEPIVIRGALGFGLKEVALAMHEHGLIQTRWGDGPADGLGVMVGAWWCAEQTAAKAVPMSTIDLMQEIQHYNEVDCKVMMEILYYLRREH